MSAISLFQTVFRVARQDGANGAGPRVTKRNRPLVACSSCRARKLKCDRQQPCLACSKRGDSAGCTFTQNRIGRLKRPEKPSEAQHRLQKLEEMVADLVSKDSQPSAVPSKGASQAPNGLNCSSYEPSASIGHGIAEPDAKTADHGAKYRGATHWSQVLEDIRELQGILNFEEEAGDEEPVVYPEGPSVAIQESGQEVTVLDLCSFLPSKDVIDEYVSDYLTKTHSVVLHTHQFMRQYEAFWANTSVVSFLWLSTLFSVCYIGANVWQNTGSLPILQHGPAPAEYLKRAGQALQAGKFFKGKPGSVEALLLYGIANFTHKRDDPETDAWLVMGLAVRLAMRQGYHRDPRRFKHLTPFQAEMRRRVFYSIATFDLLLSFQVGLPSIILDEQVDTDIPKNLYDSDFDEDSAEVRPGRPPTEPTPMLYYCTKYKQARVLRRVMQHALLPKPAPYARTMELDADVRAMHATVAPSMQMKPLDRCFGDGASTVLHRLNVETLYLKSMCVLHRPYLSRDRANPAYEYSRNTSIDAAKRILGLQAELHHACQPGGRFYKQSWIHNSLVMHDFLLAATIISLDLFEAQRAVGGDDSPEKAQARTVQFAALRNAHHIWSSRRSTSQEAKRASDVLAAMIGRLAPLPPDQVESLRPLLNGSAAHNMPADACPEVVPFGGGQVPLANGSGERAGYIASDRAAGAALDVFLAESEMLDWGQMDRLLGQEGADPSCFGLDWHALDGGLEQDRDDGGMCLR